jgi:hydroxyethylthiazole kinase-like uncharacterized protein yjeF
MQKVFEEVETLDKICYDEYNLTEDILMENASLGISNLIKKLKIENNSIHKVLIVSGSGNNGADGITLSRILHQEFEVELFLPIGIKSNMAKIQLQRAKLIGIKVVDTICSDYDIVVEAIFGTGLKRELSQNIKDIIYTINNLNSIKIACDIPTGNFCANYTVTMGAYKESLFEDKIKSNIGQVSVASLGISDDIYQSGMQNSSFLLDYSDMKLPYRKNFVNSHKGTFGHVCVVSGQKSGASILSAKSSISCGSGLTSILCKIELNIFDPQIMISKNILSTVNTICIGMGLGNTYNTDEITNIFKNNYNFVIDADMFHKKQIKDIIQNSKSKMIITPHPKEFISLLKILEIDEVTVEQLQNNRFYYLKKFSSLYPNIGIILKGANMLMAYQNKIYINTFGTSKLSKGGSGDILAGIVASLLAQDYNIDEAMITSTLILTKACENINKNDFSITAMDIIESIGFIDI